MRGRLFYLLVCLFTVGLTSHDIAARQVEIETSQVTAADITLSPDGNWLIFTMLGHLFRLPVEGGSAEQLTFGPNYDTDPVISPDGRSVAFVSDRDKSAGNIFILELATGHIRQVTHETWTGRPRWSPDGQSLVYLRFSHVENLPNLNPAVIRRVILDSGKTETISAPPRLIRSVFYLPDGSLAWTALEAKTSSVQAYSPRHWITRIEAVNTHGVLSTLHTLDGYIDRVVPSPAGDGLYGHRRQRQDAFQPEPQEIFFVPLPTGAESPIRPLGSRRWERTQFSVSTDNTSLYASDAGRLWKISLPDGGRSPLAFTARVQMDIQDPVRPPKQVFTNSRTLQIRSIVTPHLSPDSKSLVFMAAGYLWQQALNGGVTRRLFAESEAGGAFYSWPAFSPDGRQLAFVHAERGTQEVRVYDLTTQKTQTLSTGIAYAQLSWGPDGQRLTWDEFDGTAASVIVFHIPAGTKERIRTRDSWAPRPHFSADGQQLYFTANLTGSGTFYRSSLQDKGSPQPLTQLPYHISDGLVSPNGQWLAFRHNQTIGLARLETQPIQDQDVQFLSDVGGRNFSFTPDSSALIYAVGNRLWHHPLNGGERAEISIRLELPRQTAPPLLLRRVRLLDFEAKSFGPETSVLIEYGRIGWIRIEQESQLPPDTVIIDAAGRFAIPGLFDMSAHEDSTINPTFLAYGVTSIQVTGGRLAWLNTLRDRGKATHAPLPRSFFSGERLEGKHPTSGNWFFPIDTEQEIRASIQRHKEAGATFINAYASLPWPLHRTVADAARHYGLPVMTIGMNIEWIIKSITLGYAIMEHTPCPNRLYDDVLQLMAIAGTRWTPTLSFVGGDALLLRDEPERLHDKKFLRFTPAWFIRNGKKFGYMKDAEDKALRGSWVEQLAGIQAAHQHGIWLHLGPHSPAWESFVGASLHWELEHFVQAGLSPLEVLRLATQAAARAVGAEEDLGTLSPGKLADIVLLDANPLKDIRNTQTIWRVIKGGWLFDPEALHSSVDAE